ncbi:MAG: hypothetical protein GC204_04900 [Chloroflexi bacterium]|nr:hypothetical protein [Chloroflexota bacterium]
MPILVEWDTESQNVIVSTYSGRWTWEDFSNSDAAVRRLVDEAKGRAHLIIDVTRNVWFPPDMADHADQVVNSLDPRLGMIVVVGREINRELMNLLATENDKITSRYSFAYDLETAERVIEEWTKAYQDS